MVSHALVVAVVDTFHCFTVNADGLAGMRQRTGVGVHPAMLLGKTLTAGVITTAGMFSAHHNITLAAKAILIVGTIFHYTF